MTDWITVMGNAAVVAGLILVAVQIRQNTAGIRGTAYQTWVAAITDFNMNLATQPDLSNTILQGHFDPKRLDEESSVQYLMAMLGFMQVAQATYYLHKDGSIDDGLWDAELQRVAAHLALFPGVRQLWDAGLRTQLSPDFVAVAEAAAFRGAGVIWKEGEGFVSLTSEE
jgi:hypothetical protein